MCYIADLCITDYHASDTERSPVLAADFHVTQAWSCLHINGKNHIPCAHLHSLHVSCGRASLSDILQLVVFLRDYPYTPFNGAMVRRSTKTPGIGHRA